MGCIFWILYISFPDHKGTQLFNALLNKPNINVVKTLFQLVMYDESALMEQTLYLIDAAQSIWK